MKRLLAVLLCLLPLSSVSAQELLIPGPYPPMMDPRFPPDIPADPERIALGREIAKGGSIEGGVAMKCMACHGLDGQGASTGGIPRLAGLTRAYLEGQLHDFAQGDRTNPVMVPIAQGLTQTETGAVSAYYASLDPEPLTGLVEPSAERLQRGGTLAALGTPGPDGVTACSACHAVTEGYDNRTAPDIAGQPESYIRAQLVAWREGTRQNSPAGVMARIARNMTDAQIDAVATYYARKPPGPDAP